MSNATEISRITNQNYENCGLEITSWTSKQYPFIILNDFLIASIAYNDRGYNIWTINTYMRERGWS